MVLIKLQKSRKKAGASMSFRPLAGIMVLIAREKNKISRAQMGFRPLAGIMVLIGSMTAGIVLINSPFPSPCGDYGSYPHPL